MLAGHHDVQHRHVKVAVLLGVKGQGLVAGFGLVGLVAGPLQVDDHKLPDVLLVFRNKDFSHNFRFPFLAEWPLCRAFYSNVTWNWLRIWAMARRCSASWVRVWMPKTKSPWAASCS